MTDIDGRVCLQVAEVDTRETLAEWLGNRFDLAVDPDDEFAEADIYIADRDGLSAVADAVRSVRAEADPAHVPVLLVTPPVDDDAGIPVSETRISVNGGRQVDSPATDGVPVDLVDETITRPIRFPELTQRLHSLLQIRSLSVSLRERERQYHDLLDLLAEGICLVENGVIVEVNDACCQLLDIDDPSSVIGRPLETFVADADTEAVTTLLSTIMDGEPNSLSCTLVTPEDDAIPVELTGAIGDPGTPPKIQLVVRDKRARTHRKERVELFAEALHGARQGITIADVTREDAPLIYANRTFTEITGYSAPEVLGRNCRFLQGEETDPESVAQMRAAIETGEPTTVRVRNYRADGTLFWNEVTLLPVRGGTGTVTHYLGFQQDVTDRVQHERELERYRTLVQAADDPIYALDSEGYLTNVNDAFCSFTGYDRVDLIGAHASIIVDDRDVEAMEELIQDTLSGSEPPDCESTMPGTSAEIIVETADGDRRLCELSVGFLPFEKSFRGTVGILRDVTEPRGREQRLAVLERVLRHNLRNKTNVVLSRIDRIKTQEDLSESLEAEIDIVADAASDIIGLSEQARQFRDVLALQRKDLTPVDVVPIVADVVEENRSANPDACIDTVLPDTALVRTRGRLRFAIDELLDNAISHTETDAPEVVVTVTEHEDAVEIRITDDGPGIPEPERKVASREQEGPLEHGSGLGLWLVRWTVEQSRGHIVFGGSVTNDDVAPASTETDFDVPREIDDTDLDGTTVHVFLPSTG